MGVIQWVGPCTTAWERELRRRGAQGIKLCGVWPMGLLHLRGNDAKKKQGIKKNGKEWCELSSFTVLVERTTMRSRICMIISSSVDLPAGDVCSWAILWTNFRPKCPEIKNYGSE